MRTRGLATVRLLFERGEVYVDRATGEFFLYEPADPAARRAFREDWSTIAAVLRRAQAFAAQLRVPAVDPFLRLPTVYGDLTRCPACGGPSRRCQSCGAPLPGDALRCAHCELAVDLALAAPGDPAGARDPTRGVSR